MVDRGAGPLAGAVGDHVGWRTGGRVVTGDRAWALGTADGYYPAAGFHTRGEMGGFWLPNVKLLDGMWFGINDDWIGPATRTTSGWGYVRADLPATDGVAASRTDFVPDGVSGALVGLSLRADRTRTITLRADAHSELLGSYPWGETTPNQTAVNLPDSVVTSRQAPGLPRPRQPAAPQQRGAQLGRSVRHRPGPDRTPTPARTSAVRRAPARSSARPRARTRPPSRSAATTPSTARAPVASSPTESELRAGEVRTVWFGVGGSASSPAEARDRAAQGAGRPGGGAGGQARPAEPDRRSDRRSTCPATGCWRTACAGPSRCWPPRSSG